MSVTPKELANFAKEPNNTNASLASEYLKFKRLMVKISM